LQTLLPYYLIKHTENKVIHTDLLRVVRFREVIFLIFLLYHF
jgi:hypothetical protein